MPETEACPLAINHHQYSRAPGCSALLGGVEGLTQHIYTVGGRQARRLPLGSMIWIQPLAPFGCILMGLEIYQDASGDFKPQKREGFKLLYNKDHPGSF